MDSETKGDAEQPGTVTDGSPEYKAFKARVVQGRTIMASKPRGGANFLRGRQVMHDKRQCGKSVPAVVEHDEEGRDGLSSNHAADDQSRTYGEQE